MIISPNFLASFALIGNSKKYQMCIPFPDFESSINGFNPRLCDILFIALESSIKLVLSKSITKNLTKV